jgi:hypothetical protein
LQRGDAEIVDMTSPPVRIAMSLSIALPRSPEARRLHRRDLEPAMPLVDDESRESFTSISSAITNSGSRVVLIS